MAYYTKELNPPSRKKKLCITTVNKSKSTWRKELLT